jgi:hypothetical protein
MRLTIPFPDLTQCTRHVDILGAFSPFFSTHTREFFVTGGVFVTEEALVVGRGFVDPIRDAPSCAETVYPKGVSRVTTYIILEYL